MMIGRVFWMLAAAALLAGCGERKEKTYYDRLSVELYRVTFRGEKVTGASIVDAEAGSHQIEVDDGMLFVAEDLPLYSMFGGEEREYYKVVVYQPAEENTFDVIFSAASIEDGFSGVGSLDDMISRAREMEFGEGGGLRTGVLLPMPDEELAELVQNSYEEPEALGDAVRERLGANTEDPVLPLLAMDAALVLEDAHRMRELLDAHAGQMEKSPVPFYRDATDYYRMWLDHLEAANEGKDLRARLAKAEEGGFDLQAQMEFLRSLSYDFVYTEFLPLVLRGVSDNRNFLGPQTMMKTARVRGDLMLFNGRAEESFELARGAHQYAVVLMRSSGTLIGNLVGIACSAISTAAMKHAVLNGMRTEEQLRAAWPKIDEGEKAHRQALEDPMYEKIEFGVKQSTNFSRKRGQLSRRESRTRARVGYTKMALLHAGVAARYQVMAEGSYPESAEDFGPLLESGPVADVFSPESNPLSFRADPEWDFVVYSLGPDEEDDEARIEYDPTNGTISRGDLSLRVPRKRQYPFPPRGEAPGTREELLKLFPNGLPPDPFSDYRGSSYIVSDTELLVIWSVGPDVDARHMLLDKSGKPLPQPQSEAGVATYQGGYLTYINRPDEPAYDPTNGTISEGNLYQVIGE